MLAFLEYLLIAFIITASNVFIFFVISILSIAKYDKESVLSDDAIIYKCLITSSASVTILNNLIMAFIFMPYMGIATPFSRLMLAILS